MKVRKGIIGAVCALMLLTGAYVWTGSNSPADAASLGAGEYAYIGGDENLNADIRVLEGGSADIYFELKYKDPSGVTLTGLGSTFFYVNYGRTDDRDVFMTYSSNGTGITGTGEITLDRNNIETKTTGSYAKYYGQARFVRAAINNLKFTVKMPVSNIKKTYSLKCSPIEAFGKTTGIDMPELNYNSGAAQTAKVIVQKRVKTVLKNTASDTSVQASFSYYSNASTGSSEKTFAQSGTLTTVGSGDFYYVDTGTENAKQTFTIKAGSGKDVDKIKINNTDVNYTKSGSKYSLKTGITDDSTVTISFKDEEKPHVEKTKDEKIKIYFDSRGGDYTPATQTINKGEKVKAPTTPKR